MNRKLVTMLIALILVICVVPVTAMADCVDCSHVCGDGTCSYQAAVSCTCEEIAWYHQFPDSAECTKKEGVPCNHECPPECEHNFVKNGAQFEEPTCTEGATEVWVCSKCGEVDVRNVSALGHAPGEAVKENVVVGDCETPGSYESVVYCTRCGEEQSRETVAGELGEHNFVKNGAQFEEPTCTEGATQIWCCTICGRVDPRNVEALGHVPGEAVKENVVAGDCENPGSYDSVVYCTRCGEEQSRETVAGELGEHNFVKNGAQFEEPTCTEGATQIWCCTICGRVDPRHVDALGHAPVTDPAVAATCTATGLTEGSHCERCGDILVAQEETPLAAHTSAVDAAVPATCEKSGLTEGSHCSVCDTVLVEQKVVAKLGHDWDEGEVTKKPTTTKKGEKTYTCKNDPTHTKTEEIAKLKAASTKGLDNVPKTGDAGIVVLPALALVVLFGTAFLFTRKRSV